MKKYLALVLAVLMALACMALVACGECKHFYHQGYCLECGQPDPNYNPNQGGGTTSSEDQTISDAALKCTNTGTIYVTAIGRSGAETTITGILDNLGVTYVLSEELKATDVTANDIVICVAGSSGKGLGEAGGPTVESEIARFNGIAAVEGVEIISIVPAKNLRGEKSDPLHEAVGPKAMVSLVLTEANTNNFFTNLCAEGTLFTYSKASKMSASLEFLLGA